jgi:hypothetical protein
MQPMNYMLDVQKPFDGALQGIQAGLDVSNAMDQSAARQQELQQKQDALAQHQQMQGDLAKLSQNPNPSAHDFASITTKYPSLAEHFKNTWSMLNTDQQQAKLNHTSQVYAALSAGKPEIASKLLADQALALRNSGKEDEAKASDTLSQLITMSPETAKTSAGLMLASVLGPEKFSSTFSTLSKLPGEVAAGEAGAVKAKYEANNTPQRLALENVYKGAEIRNLDSQVGERAGRLGLDRDKLQTETELKLYELNMKGNPAFNLDGDAKKIINDSTVSSVAADQSAGQITDLASRLEKEGGGYGALSTASEWMKKATGNQDSMTQMRNEYTRIRNSQAMKMLPPGPASDKDVAMAMSGFPSETADAKTMASFLRGMAKLNQYTAVSDNAKAEWVNAVGHLGKPKTDINVDGVNVPTGSTFTDFARQYMASKVEQKQTQAAQQQVQSRSYMRWAQPQGAQ